MTVKELKEELEQLPEEAEAFFTLWTADGPKHYWFNPSMGNQLYDGTKNKKFAQIAFTDDCAAQRLYGDDGKLHYLGEGIKTEPEKTTQMEEVVEKIKEKTWNLCKEYDVSYTRKQARTKVRLTNFISTKLAEKYGAMIENLYRTEWMAEVNLFCEKYSYSE